MKNLSKYQKNDNYTTGNLLHYLFHQTYWYTFIKTNK